LKPKRFDFSPCLIYFHAAFCKLINFPLHLFFFFNKKFITGSFHFEDTFYRYLKKKFNVKTANHEAPLIIFTPQNVIHICKNKRVFLNTIIESFFFLVKSRVVQR